jgi:cytoskeleton protein RodZ
VSLACLSVARLTSKNLVMQDISLNSENSIAQLSVSAGQMLKQARLDAGLHIAALAVALRVPVKRIEALENGQMDLLPDMVFIRALASSICQVLKIDALPILEKLPKAALPRLNRADISINTPIGAAGTGSRSLLNDIFSSPWLLGVAFLCISAAGVYFWPKASSLSAPELVVSAKGIPDTGVSQAKELLVVTENLLVNKPNVTAVNTSETTLNTHPITHPMAIPVIAGTTSPVASNIPLPPADSIVIFKASGETWVEVKNSAGGTVFKKLLNAGDNVGASGILPLTVIVGRADVTQVEVRGKPVDLASIAKSNVARFEVN